MKNGVMFQSFHWYTKSDGKFWAKLAESAPRLASQGFSAVWIPPAYKAAGGKDDPGYAVYDLFDLGEFPQKGETRTKYGEKHELLAAVRALRSRNLNVYADMVFNHRSGGDQLEELEVVAVNRKDRNQVESDPFTIHSYTAFTFAGRKGEHSEMQWHAEHFTAVDYNHDAPDEKRIYRLADKTFSGEVSFEYGNYDFLLGCDVDTYHPEVRGELDYFARWFVDTTQVDGFRMDALKHLPASFIKDWLAAVRTHFSDRELLAVGEYWAPDLDELRGYHDAVEQSLHLFDVPLHFRFLEASKVGKDFDLRTIFDGSFVSERPEHAVTFVDNHDTQPGCSLESWLEPWFKPLAYALILLRKDGYPCVLSADYFGHDEPALISHQTLLDAFLSARQTHNHGEQVDAFDHPQCIAWMRKGDEEAPKAMVVVMSSGDPGTKVFETGKPNAEFYDCTGHDEEGVTTDDEGKAQFRCPAGSLSVWLER